MHILNHYLGRIILQYSTLTLLILVGLFTFVNFLEQLSDLGRGGYMLVDALLYVVLTIPGTVYEIFPMTALLGTIIGLSLLANDYELIAMRASGISMLQITSAALKMGGLFVIAAVIIGEVVAPYSQTRAERMRAEALQQEIKQQSNFGLWMRDQSTYINVGEVLPDLTLLQLKVFEFDQNKKLRSMVLAKEGKYDGTSWVISGVKQTLINPSGEATAIELPVANWSSQVTPQILSVFLIKPDQLSFWQLSRYMRHLRENQQKTDSYELAYWNKIMLPLSTAVMVFLAIPFVFANIRSGTMGRSLFIGIMLGLGFFAANKGFGYIVLVSGMSPLLGTVVPVIGFLILATIMMRRVERQD